MRNDTSPQRETESVDMGHQSWLIDRRYALRGLGSFIALPLLDCMFPARAAGAGTAEAPRRSAFIYLPNGVNTLDGRRNSAAWHEPLS